MYFKAAPLLVTLSVSRVKCVLVCMVSMATQQRRTHYLKSSRKLVKEQIVSPIKAKLKVLAIMTILKLEEIPCCKGDLQQEELVHLTRQMV